MRKATHRTGRLLIATVMVAAFAVGAKQVMAAHNAQWCHTPPDVCSVDAECDFPCYWFHGTWYGGTCEVQFGYCCLHFE